MTKYKYQQLWKNRNKSLADRREDVEGSIVANIILTSDKAWSWESLLKSDKITDL